MPRHYDSLEKFLNDNYANEGGWSKFIEMVNAGYNDVLIGEHFRHVHPQTVWRWRHKLGRVDSVQQAEL